MEFRQNFSVILYVRGILEWKELYGGATMLTEWQPLNLISSIFIHYTYN